MKRSSEFILREVADTLVLVPIGDAAVRFPGMITVNATGAYIWELLEKEQTLETLTEALMQAYAVEQATARADAEAFVEKLIPVGAVLEN